MQLVIARVPGSPRGGVLAIGAIDDVEAIGQVVAEGRWPRRVNGHRALAGALLDADVFERLREQSPHEVYLVLGGAMDEEMVSELGSRLLMDGVAVHLVLPQLSGPPVHAESVRIGSRFSISLHAVREGWLGRSIRRAVDVVGALTLLVLLSPVLALVACLVRWRLGRPVIFTQKRFGEAGRLFRLFKFRSMVQNAEQVLAASPEVYQRYVASNYKLPEDEDPRITPLGRFLRRTSLDELPQLWNVVRGDMSLVGPRPIVPEEIAEYGDYGRLLLRVKPGLTGLWQVSGRSQIGYPERARMDLRYLGERTLGRDLQILLRTLPAVISRRGAL
jgi:lipopolysaccharide/colanic/teichoic acid biosynthesis glycosyltransferase